MNKWVAKLQKLEGVVTERKDRFAKVVRTSSPSANYIYGRTHGLPFGYTQVLYGPPKGGKSVLQHMQIGWLHQNDPDAIAFKFDTEYRTDGQLDDDAMALFGIDPERLVICQTNVPAHVFDQTEKDIAALCEQGAPIRYIGIDSITGVQGRRELVSESIDKFTVGDQAQTVQIGLKKILPIIRKYDIAVSMIAQVRAEMDQTEVMRGNKVKMAGSFGLQHMAEYFIYVEQNKTLKGRKDLLGKEFVNEELKDLADKGEVTALKIRVKMKDSSMGPKGRTGEFTWHTRQGLVNVHEEVFSLATGYNIIERPNDKTYVFGGEQWIGKEKFINALKNSPQLQAEVMAEFMRRDLAGSFDVADASAAADEE